MQLRNPKPLAASYKCTMPSPRPDCVFGDPDAPGSALTHASDTTTATSDDILTAPTHASDTTTATSDDVLRAPTKLFRSGDERFEQGDPSTGRPRLPVGYSLELSGRGTTFVRQLSDAYPKHRPTLILLHGWSVTGALNWFRVYEPLAEFADVISIDHRGHGQGIRSRSRFRLVDAADDVAAMLHTMRCENPIVVVGYSMGGAVAQLVARDHPELVDGVVLAATWARLPRSARQTRLLHTAGAVAPLTKPLSRRRQLALLARGFRVASRPGDTEPLRWFATEIGSAELPALLEAGGELARFDSRSWVSGINAAVGIAVTTLDQVVDAGTQHVLASQLPQARITHIPITHAGCVTRPDVFVKPFVDLIRNVTMEAQSRRTNRKTHR